MFFRVSHWSGASPIDARLAINPEWLPSANSDRPLDSGTDAAIAHLVAQGGKPRDGALHSECSVGTYRPWLNRRSALIVHQRRGQLQGKATG
jgi:hypothetical protein